MIPQGERRKNMEQPALLEMRGICKEFPGVKAWTTWT